MSGSRGSNKRGVHTRRRPQRRIGARCDAAESDRVTLGTRICPPRSPLLADSARLWEHCASGNTAPPSSAWTGYASSRLVGAAEVASASDAFELMMRFWARRKIAVQDAMRGLQLAGSARINSRDR